MLFTLLLLMAVPQTAQAQDEPTIAKDSVVVSTTQDFGGLRCPDCWRPGITFRVNGPIASGSKLWVEFGIPGTKERVTLECETGEIGKGEWWTTGCLAGPDKKAAFTGLVDFAIHMRNALAGTNTTLFTGKAKVGKHRRSPTSKEFEYYVDEDWRIPIGYLYTRSGYRHVNALNADIWFRDNPPEVRGYLFYQGKEIDKNRCTPGGNSDRDPVTGAAYVWTMIDCEFQETLETDPGAHASPGFHVLSQNPGDYEIKVLQAGQLTRTAKFTVNADGSFDNGIASANKLGSNRVIVPVKVMGNPDGPWDPLAWKTGAFYGNPLTGFTIP